MLSFSGLLRRIFRAASGCFGHFGAFGRHFGAFRRRFGAFLAFFGAFWGRFGLLRACFGAFRGFFELFRGRWGAALPVAQRNGWLGEAAAARFLRRERGMRILARNWYGGGGELDIVAKDGATLVFVEVRARAADALVRGFETVGKAKRARLKRASRAYLGALASSARAMPTRLDVVQVAISSDCIDIEHYENV